MSGAPITKALTTTDGRVLIEQPDGTYRPAESQTDWTRLDAMTGEEVERKRSQGDSPVEIQCRSPLFLADAPHILCYRSAHAT